MARNPILSRRQAIWLALGCVLYLAAAPLPAPGQDVLDEIMAEGSESWWNPAWTRRVEVTIEDPRAFDSRDGIVLLREPSPLWLYNTAPCADGLADLRAVDQEGREWPAGVLNFGQDDGSSCLWIKRLEEAPKGGLASPVAGVKTIRLMLYYGNRGASPSSRGPPDCTPLKFGQASLDRRFREPLAVQLGPEERAPGAACPAESEQASPFFDSMVLLDAEDMVGPDGKRPGRWWGDTRFLKAPHESASDGAYLAPEKPGAKVEVAYPVTGCATVEVPQAGTWIAHARYRVQPDSARGFLLNVGGSEHRCGTNQAPGALFRYDSFPVSLEAGSASVTVRFEGPAGLDCILLSADPRYRPDVADVNGPVWMRFRADNPRFPPFHIHLFCVTTPMSQKGPIGQTAAMLFRDRLALSGYDYTAALREPGRLLKPGEWSPWARALHSSSPTWWTEVMLLGRAASHDTHFLVPDKPPGGGLTGTTLACAFATRPDARRAFRVETGLALDSGGLQVGMPTRLTLARLQRDALTFDAWARRRFEEFVAPLNLKPSPPPREFLLYTTVDASSRSQTDYAVKTLGLLGFNAVGVGMYREPETYWRMAESNGVAFTGMGHWLPGLGLTAPYVLRPLRRELEPGEDAERAVLGSFAESARNFYTPDSGGRRRDLERVRFFPMGDEIGPSTDGIYIKRLPLVRGWFHAFLREHGQTPGSFGKTNWAGVDAAGNITNIPPGSWLDSILTGIDPALRAVTSNELAQAEATKEEAIGAVLGTREVRDVLEDADEPGPALEPDAVRFTPEEKRLHYWTQRFRSYYTARFYGICDQALAELEAQGAFRHPPMASPNFQAAPMHHGHFWDGALNLFEWGRLKGTRYMLMEDWTWDPYKVAWGRTLLRGAARKNGQKLVSLLVGSGVTQRFLVDLGNGVKGVEAYRYGPIARIGPAWADDPGTLREWADLSRMTARWETDILAASNRPAQAAILVDNTAEINARYLHTSFRRGEPLFDRVAMFVALSDAGVPIEVVGAEEVLEDDSLARLKALYVCDPHMDRRVQERIRDWVRAGGVLWASYAAGARDEYDEPSAILDPVFGLAARPSLTNSPAKWALEEEPEIRIELGDGLPAVAFRSVPLKPAWSLAPGVEVLGRFSDGSAAFIRNSYGKGQVFLLGSVVWRLTGGATSSRTPEPPEAAALREVAAVAARAAGAEPHLRKSHPRVLAFVHDGPRQAVVYLANCFEKALLDFRVEVRLPRRPASASFGRGGRAEFAWRDDGWAGVACPLDLVSGEFIVFHYDEQAAGSRPEPEATAP